MLMEILKVIGEVAIEMDTASYTEEEKMKISEVKGILQRHNCTEAVQALDAVINNMSSYNKPGRSLSARESSDSIYEQELKIRKRLNKIANCDQINDLYYRVESGDDCVIVYLSQSYFNIRNMSKTNIGNGAAMIIRDYHVQTVTKGYSRLVAEYYEKAMSKIADAIS